jgi:glycosyltransferase involved in cell wall biosynthesis
MPFWNEDMQLFSVLNEASQINNILELICVDDASDYDYSDEIRARFPMIRLKRLPKNMGKSDAVREGLKMARGENILLLDADLQNLNHAEIETAIEIFESRNDLDMLILRRVNADLLIRLYRGDVLFTGERILRKRDREVILRGQVKRWQLESVINTWMYIHDKKVLWMPYSGTNTDKALKWGIMNGFLFDLKTFGDMMFATGFNNFLRQILFYAKQELKVK